MFCLPILKHEKHREAVAAAAVSGDPRFFLGTDSAPHAVGDKVNYPPCSPPIPLRKEVVDRPPFVLLLTDASSRLCECYSPA